MSNILFIGSECVPYAKSGGLADVMGSLPTAMAALGLNVAVMLPLYKQAEETHLAKMQFMGQTDVSLAWRKQYLGVYSCQEGNITYYFLDNRQYFHRDSLYGYDDDAERFAYFSKAALAALPLLHTFPDVLHCNDWQTALIPVYLKTQFSQREAYSKLKTVFTIHNIEYQGKFHAGILSDVIGIDEKDRGIVDYKNNINLMKGAVVACDQLTTVSPSYAQEIMYPFYGHGLETIIAEHSQKLTGILNGIDTKVYNTFTDKYLSVNYGLKTIEKKRENKIALQKELGLAVEGNTPMVGMITRLVDHKGIALVCAIFDELMSKDVQFVLLGTGEDKYERFFRAKAHQMPGRVAAMSTFSPRLASRIYAGSDMFLMPSVSEPCGLSQMIALRYGTVPIVRVTGGLADSVTAFSPLSGEGNGITFCTINAHDMLWAVNRGLEYYADKEVWNKLRSNAFKSDFSWKRSARQYHKIYKDLMKPLNKTHRKEPSNES
jgi:starch synthase